MFSLTSGTARAEQIKFAFRTGATYEYELTSSSGSSSNSMGRNFSDTSNKSKSKFELKIIDFQDGAFIVDIKSNEKTLRRYIKENGDISGAPGEAGKQVPFFLAMPEIDWQQGQRHQTDRPLKLGKVEIPAIWQLLLKAIDKEKGTAEVWFTANAKLPEDKVRQKSFSLKGKMTFDLSQGIINKADWSTQYTFSLKNKEIAVTRDLWKFDEKSIFSLKLLDIKE